MDIALFPVLLHLSGIHSHVKLDTFSLFKTYIIPSHLFLNHFSWLRACVRALCRSCCWASLWFKLYVISAIVVFCLWCPETGVWVCFSVCVSVWILAALRSLVLMVCVFKMCFMIIIPSSAEIVSSAMLLFSESGNNTLLWCKLVSNL